MNPSELPDTLIENVWEICGALTEDLPFSATSNCKIG
jgi:hypothetical protein